MQKPVNTPPFTHPRRRGLTALGVLLTSGVTSLSYAQDEVSAEVASPDVAPPESALASEGHFPIESTDPPEYAGRRAERGYATGSGSADLLPYMKRYVPQRNQWEVTLAVGLLFPSPSHNLKVPELPVDEYSKVAPQLSVRLGYFPLSFLGAEVQTFMAGSKLKESGYSAALYGASGHLVVQLPLASIVPYATVGIGTLGAISETMGHDRDFSFIWGLGAKAAVSQRVNLRLDFQDNLGQKRDAKNGRQTHHPAVQLGVSFVFERVAARQPLMDADYDGLYDRDDQCPSEGALTHDGCPAVADTDKDGVGDPQDKCPTEAGAAPEGCPDRDLDKDGVLIPEDHCPDEAGEAPSGCANVDADGDGIDASLDRCPKEPESKNGFEDQDGCPDEVPAEIKRFTGVIPGINFKQGTAEIAATSYPVLDEATKILVDYPSIQIEVSGHTSSEGAEKRNQELSVARAEAVKKYFVDKGVLPERVVARGAGASEPVADNETRDGREQNRRIEFRVLMQP